MDNHPAAKRISMGLIALVAWFAVILQLKLMLGNAASIGFSVSATITNFLSYFTILSNILVAICLSIVLLLPSSTTGQFFARTSVQSAIALYIFIVGLVYNLVLRNIWSPTGWQLVADNLLHVAVPVLFVAYWFFFIPRKELQWKDLLRWLIFPAIYLVYSLIRGSITGWYPYPFLHAGKSGYGTVALNACLVLLAFLVIGLGIIVINRSGTLKEPKA